MKQEQKIALALALIGGGYYFNKNEETRSRNGSKRLTPTDKILEVLENDKILSAKKLKNISTETNGIMGGNIVKGYFRFTGDYKEDQEYNKRGIEMFKDFNSDYYNSVIRRSGIYLDRGMFENLMNAITGIDDDQRDFISKKAGIIDQIQYDFGEDKKIYNILTEDNKELKNYGSKAKYVRADFIMKFFKLESKLALAIAIGLEKIGYYDQDQDQE